MLSSLFVQVWTMFLKDLRLVYRNPVAFGLLVIMPFLLIAVISNALTPIFEGASSFRLPVVDLDRSQASEQLVEALDESSALEVRELDWTGSEFAPDDADAVFDDDRKNFVVLVIPDGFGDSIAEGDPRSLTLFTDPVQQGFSDLILQEVRSRLFTTSLVSAFTSVLVSAGGLTEEEALAVVDSEIAPLEEDPGTAVIKRSGSETRALPSNFEQTVPGFSVMFTFWLAAIIAGGIFAEKRVYRTWQRTLIAPVPRWAIIASRIAAYVTLGLAQMTLLFAAGWLFFGLSLGSDIPALILLLTAVALVTTTFGFLISSLIKDAVLMNMTTNLLVLILAGLGGAIVPIVLLPGWAQQLSVLTPHYWAMHGIQQVIILDNGLADVLPQLLALLTFAAAFFSIGLWRFRFND
jgi:ABC-2 type transport system permease protein